MHPTEGLPALLVLLLQMAVITMGSGSLLALFVGGLLLFSPTRAERLARRLNRWHSTHHYLHFLDRPHYWERYLYRRHRWFGGLIALGALVVLGSLTWGGLAVSIEQLALEWGPTVEAGAWLAQAATLCLYLGNLLALAIGIAIFLRPSALRGLERIANRWFSTHRLLRPLDHPHPELEAWLLRHRLMTGITLVVGGGYLLMHLPLLIEGLF